MSGTGVVERKEENGDGTTVGEGGDLAEIEVERQQDTCFTGSLLENLAVRQAMQLLIAEMDRVMSVLVEPLHHPDIRAHVGQEAHSGPPLRRPYLLLRQPGGVGESLLDVLPLEVRIPLEDRLC
jgi:hypothetical protein